MSRRLESSLETSTFLYCNAYLRSKNLKSTEFRGVKLSDLKTIEILFQVNVLVFTLENSNGEIKAKCERKSQTNHDENLYLHLQGNHFCFIKNLDLYSKSYKCEDCDTLYTTATALRRHWYSCSSETKYRYPAGEFKGSTSVFDRQSEVGINLDSSPRHHSLFAVFDCESYMSKTDLPHRTDTITWDCEHKLASVSIASNIAGYREPVCFVNDSDDEKAVVEKMVTYLEILAETANERQRERYKDIFKKIDVKREKDIEKHVKEFPLIYSSKVSSFYDQLEDDLESYIRDLPVIGYNSRRYDINLIRKHLFDCLEQCDDPIDYVIKRGNCYMCVTTMNLKFLDIMNYVGPGYSYSDYLRAYEVTDVGKSIWIHSRFDSLDMLKRTDFPAYKELYNDIKGCNVSPEEYENCRKVWITHGFTTLRDLLIFYNNQDVAGFVTAVERQMEFFRSKGLDVKSSISLPGWLSLS